MFIRITLNIVVVVSLFIYAVGAFAGSCDKHPWGKSLPKSYDEGKFNPITDLSNPVIESEIAEANKMLQDVSIIEVSDAKASSLIGEPFKNQTAYRLYLVRALKDSNSANIVVYRYKDVLFLESVGMEPAKSVVKSPLVVMLDSIPSQIYISCMNAM